MKIKDWYMSTFLYTGWLEFKEFLKMLKEIPPDKDLKEQILRSLEWDSKDSLTIHDELNAHFNVRIPLGKTYGCLIDLKERGVLHSSINDGIVFWRRGGIPKTKQLMEFNAQAVVATG